MYLWFCVNMYLILAFVYTYTYVCGTIVGLCVRVCSPCNCVYICHG